MMRSSTLSIPLKGFGTWRLTGTACREATERALEVGYRHIDTAHAYENHREVGEAIKGVAREELFLTSKLWMDDLPKQRAMRACERALRELATDYLDLWLIHWPDPDGKTPIGETLEAMAQQREEGKVRHIGVSNFTIRHLEEALETGIPFEVNQIELHPRLAQPELLAFCRDHGIHVTAYSPLMRGAALRDPELLEVGKRHGKNGAQVVLRWLYQKDISAIPRSSKPQHIRSNFDIDDFSLSAEEMQQIDSLDRKQRLTTPEWATW